MPLPLSLRRSSDENVIDQLICKATRAHAFKDPGGHFFSKTSTADIFEADASGGFLRSGVRDGELRTAIQADAPSHRKSGRTRAIFIEGIEADPERLPLESSMLEEIFSTYDITPRFADFLVRQHMPGRAIHTISGSRDLERHELWYSAVIRTHNDYEPNNNDKSRLVVYWQRMCIWADYSVNGDATFLILRCPLNIKERLYDAFLGEAGLSLRQHPMLLHAFLAEHLVIHAYDFLQFFADPLYTWENKVDQLHTTEDYTERSKAFLSLSRQIHQVATDYDILAETVEHLQKQAAWFNEWLMGSSGDASSERVQKMMDAQRVLNDTFDNLLKDVKLIGTYSNLYLERSKIGVSECFAMVAQRDAETNISVATESASIARASHQDNQSLRIIQILSMIFLPASLISSIFGMGFFNTQPRGDGSAQFTISGNWWWYVAIAIPVTLLLWIYMTWYRWYTRRKVALLVDGVEAHEETAAKEKSETRRRRRSSGGEVDVEAQEVRFEGKSG